MGYYNTIPSGIVQSLIESWNGAAWSIVPSPNQGSSSNYLLSVSCANVTNCASDGSYYNGSIYQILMESWNGTAWSITSKPDQGSNEHDLFGISCSGSKSCVAVGDYYDHHLNADQALIESWDGATWTVTPSPDKGTTTNLLSGVSCWSSTECVAVGSGPNKKASAYRTLVEIGST